MPLPHHRTRRGPGGWLIAAGVILMAAAIGIVGFHFWREGAPKAASPNTAQAAAPGPQKLSTKCRFTEGDRAGQTVDFAPHAPLPVGSDCNDGTASSGVVVE